ncbi:MAG: hypothetical protein ACP5KW_04280 [Thermoproteota archaeon]|jgi:hypothetical protein
MDKVRSAFLLVLFSSIVFAITSPYLIARLSYPLHSDFLRSTLIPLVSVVSLILILVGFLVINVEYLKIKKSEKEAKNQK